MMKKFLLFILTVFTVTGVSVTASYAKPPTLDAGCDPQMMTILTNQANAVRARDRAYEMEIISRAPSTLYLTCFDQAMALSARLGYIFSDNITSDPPPANTTAFTDTLLYPDWGATHSLVVDLDTVVTPLIDAWLGGEIVSGTTSPTATDPAVFNFYPQWTTPNALTQLATTVQKVLNQIASFQSSESGQLTAYNNLVIQIDKLVGTFPTLAWNALPSALTQYKQLVQQLNKMALKIEKARKSKIDPLLSQIKNDIFNTKMTCTNLDDMWDGAGNFDISSNSDSNTTTVFYSPEGPYNLLTPFYSMKDIMNYGCSSGDMSCSLTVPKNKSGVATFYFHTELVQSTDTALLKAALNDLAPPSGVLSQPGASTLWPAPPTLPSYFETQDVIQQM